MRIPGIAEKNKRVVILEIKMPIPKATKQDNNDFKVNIDNHRSSFSNSDGISYVKVTPKITS